MNSPDRIRVAFVIPSLSTGGAQMMLLKLLSRLDPSRFEPSVFCLTDLLPLAERFEEVGVPVESMHLSRRLPDPRCVSRLAARLKAFRPRIVQTWMYHADLIGGLAARMAGIDAVIWNIRHSDLDPCRDKRSTLLVVKACALLSRRVPQRIVCCAESAQRLHADLGYRAEKLVVIPNGFDLRTFRPDPDARDRLRRELGLPGEAVVIGLAARFHHQKDHRTFLKAAGSCAARFPQVHFVLCGDGIGPDNRQLAGWIRETGFVDRFHLLGTRSDMPTVTSAFDIACSTSANGEGFPNVLGEAMACAVPCVATDVGDSAMIIGTTGRVVPAGQPGELAAAWLELIALGSEGRRKLGIQARERVVGEFSLERVVARYEELYTSLLAAADRPGGAP